MSLYDWYQVKSEYVEIKFSGPVKSSSLVNANFTVTNDTSGTPTTITDPFTTIDLTRDYSSLSRVLKLWFNFTIEADSDYSISIANILDVRGIVIATETIAFTTEPDYTASDEIEEPPTRTPVEVEDYSVKSISTILTSTSSSSALVLEQVLPAYSDARYLSESFNNGVIQITFGSAIAANFLTSEFFTLQRKLVTGYISRWETVSTQIYYDSGTYTVLVCLPSTEADQDVVYMTADRIYWELDYKYRLRMNSTISSANESVVESDIDETSYNLVCYQGSSFTRTISLSDSDGLSLDLTGYTARMQVRPSVYSETVLIELTTENGRIVIDEADGTITLVLSASETSSITGSGVYDLELVSPSDFVTRPMFGNFTLIPEVTR